MLLPGVEKVPGNPVFAGTVNGEGAPEVKVTRLAKDSSPARVMKMVEPVSVMDEAEPLTGRGLCAGSNEKIVKLTEFRADLMPEAKLAHWE